MPSSNESTRPSPTEFWAGWAITVLVLGLLTFSGILKLMQPEPVVEEFERLGYAKYHPIAIGVVELACAAIYALPRTVVLGAILLTGYLGGATATHVRIADPYYGPIVVGILVWLGIYLRDRRLRCLVPFRS